MNGQLRSLAASNPLCASSEQVLDRFDRRSFASALDAPFHSEPRDLLRRLKPLQLPGRHGGQLIRDRVIRPRAESSPLESRFRDLRQGDAR